MDAWHKDPLKTFDMETCYLLLTLNVYSNTPETLVKNDLCVVDRSTSFSVSRTPSLSILAKIDEKLLVTLLCISRHILSTLSLWVELPVFTHEGLSL